MGWFPASVHLVWWQSSGPDTCLWESKKEKNPLIARGSVRASAAGDCNTQTYFLISCLVSLKEAWKVFVWDCREQATPSQCDRTDQQIELHRFLQDGCLSCPGTCSDHLPDLNRSANFSCSQAESEPFVRHKRVNGVFAMLG